MRRYIEKHETGFVLAGSSKRPKTMFQHSEACQLKKRAKNKSESVLPMDLMYFGPREYWTSDLFKLEGKTFSTVKVRVCHLVVSHKQCRHNIHHTCDSLCGLAYSQKSAEKNLQL